MQQFNVRVYGILLTPEKDVLVADELIRGSYYTKFPGGGLEFGEGTRDCLKREFKEEMNLDVKVTDHLYTTDFFQMSAFNPEDQIISIYYFVEALEPGAVPIRSTEFAFDEAQMAIYKERGETETFRYISPRQILCRQRYPAHRQGSGHDAERTTRQVKYRVRPVAPVPASDLYSVASGDTVLAGGKQIAVTRGSASDWWPLK